MPLQRILKSRPRPLLSPCKRLIQRPDIIRRTFEALPRHGILIRHRLNLAAREILNQDLGTRVKSVNRCSSSFDTDFTILTSDSPNEGGGSFERRRATESDGGWGVVVRRQRALDVDEVGDVGFDGLEDFAGRGEDLDVRAEKREVG